MSMLVAVFQLLVGLATLIVDVVALKRTDPPHRDGSRLYQNEDGSPRRK